MQKEEFCSIPETSELQWLALSLVHGLGFRSIHEMLNAEKSMSELLVKEFSNNEYDRVIDLITNNYKPNQKTIIETSHSYYSLEKGVEKYKEVYKEILGE